MLRLSLRFLVVSCAALAGTFAAAQEWTRFHGPNGTGESESASIPVKWTEADYNWKTRLPGIGHSSPVLWGSKLFVMSADPENATRHVLCLSADSGKILWERTYPSTHHHLHQRNSFASCTPAVDDERVYVAWSTPERTTFLALDHDGNDVWQKDLGTWVSQHGFGTSPMIYDDLVILSNSQQAHQLKPGEIPGKSFMMAFNRKSGEEVWRAPRVSVNVCYSVPCIYKPADGPDELLCTSTGNGVFSLDPRTGKENWSVSDAFTMRTVSSPLVVSGLVFGTTGSGGGGNYLVAVRPGKDAELVYKLTNKAPYVSTSVAYGDLLFLFEDKGFVSCISAATGTVHWQVRVERAAFSGSPVRVRDKIYCIDEAGDVIVIAVDKEYRLLARNPLGEPSRSTPAVAGGQMFLRTESHVIAIGAKKL